jgi:bacterioferritin
MQGQIEIIRLLNAVLTNELTAVNQYFLHARMYENWGFSRLGKLIYDESIGEMKHADRLIKRILVPGGAAKSAGSHKLRIGETVAEGPGGGPVGGVERARDARAGIKQCETAGDYISREQLKDNSRRHRGPHRLPGNAAESAPGPRRSELSAERDVAEWEQPQRYGLNGGGAESPLLTPISASSPVRRKERSRPARDCSRRRRTRMDLLDEVGDKLEDTLNAEGRHPAHVTLGIVVCIGVVAATALLASRAEPGEFQRSVEKHSDAERGVLSQIWPTLFSLTTLAAVRIWNAPHSPARTRALALWGLGQVFHGAWLMISPRRRALQVAGRRDHRRPDRGLRAAGAPRGSQGRRHGRAHGGHGHRQPLHRRTLAPDKARPGGGGGTHGAALSLVPPPQRSPGGKTSS